MRPQELLEILSVAEKLKCSTRHCYTSNGRHESVAEHSWRLALMAMLLSGEEEFQAVLISEEDTSKRSANMKYFVNEDHSYTAAVYADPVHYLDNGEWKEINNQLQDGETEEGTEFLENKKNSLSVKFAKKSNGNKLVKIKLDDYQIHWKLEGAKKVDASEVESISGLEKGKQLGRRVFTYYKIHALKFIVNHTNKL